MKFTTLNAIREKFPCVEGWAKLLAHLGKTKADDEPLLFAMILESNGFDDALWCMRAAQQYDKEWRLFAVWCARQVEHLMTDKRSKTGLDVAERFANGEATQEELTAARAAALDAAAGAAAGAAAWAAIRAVAWAAAAGAAASGAAAAGDAARAAQQKEFLRIISK